MVKKPQKIEVVGVISKAYLDRSGLTTLRKINTFLESKNIKILYEKNAARYLKANLTSAKIIMREADFVITVGGDGTLIKLAENIAYKVVPILAVNQGHLGALTEVQNSEKILEVLKTVFNRRYHLDERQMLRVTIYRQGEKIYTTLALNEVVINQGNFARLIDLNAEINQRKMVRFKADGIIIATTTGSTAHSLSAGGPIVHPKIAAFIFTPICPAALSMRPIVIPSSRQLTITIETHRKFKDNYVACTVDGQRSMKLEYGDQIKIRRSKRSFYLARISNTKYYKVLRDLLAWGD
ncbi:MAG: ATP-NAD/AcoX kinase, NAD+ kinase [Candidatus Peregrinibacteria bacterium GW2011_GWF2_39_17]|nr:MAG: ATP-NAD/AcoX kinase, NAD+ kinase [Candidatus Peregrinibacteria bacterium GW2011_GWF2_39_17]HCW32543.1 NAD(+) kinase [Candidatus Peregrinibacteria bacterium]